MQKTCCVIGPHIVPADTMSGVEDKLRGEIRMAVADGFRIYLSGFTTEIDLLFAEMITEQRKTWPKLFLEASLPYPGYIEDSNKRFRTLLKKCDGIGVCGEAHTIGSIATRDRMMIDQSHRVIGVYDGLARGYTLSALQYASEREKEIRFIKI